MSVPSQLTLLPFHPTFTHTSISPDPSLALSPYHFIPSHSMSLFAIPPPSITIHCHPGILPPPISTSAPLPWLLLSFQLHFFKIRQDHITPHPSSPPASLKTLVTNANYLALTLHLNNPLHFMQSDGSLPSSGLYYQFHQSSHRVSVLNPPTHLYAGSFDSCRPWIYHGYTYHNPSIYWVTHEEKIWSSMSSDLSGDAFRSPPLCTFPEPSSPPSSSATAGSSHTLLPSSLVALFAIPMPHLVRPVPPSKPSIEALGTLYAISNLLLILLGINPAPIFLHFACLQESHPSNIPTSGLCQTHPIIVYFSFYLFFPRIHRFWHPNSLFSPQFFPLPFAPPPLHGSFPPLLSSPVHLYSFLTHFSFPYFLSRPSPFWLPSSPPPSQPFGYPFWPCSHLFGSSQYLCPSLRLLSLRPSAPFQWESGPSFAISASVSSTPHQFSVYSSKFHGFVHLKVHPFQYLPSKFLPFLQFCSVCRRIPSLPFIPLRLTIKYHRILQFPPALHLHMVSPRGLSSKRGDTVTPMQATSSQAISA